MSLAATDCAEAHGAVVWETCACLLCGGACHERVFDSRLPCSVVRCKNCDLVFTNPRPAASSIAAFYPKEYRCHQGRVDAEKRVDPLAAYLPRRPGRLLDFGCGGGDFLARMRRAGWEVVGLDVSTSAVERVRDHLGLQAHIGTLPCPAWPNDCFDAITMRQSLEHVHDPLGVIRDARRLLRPGGTLLVTVPNFASLASSCFGSAWYGLDLPRHLTHFTPSTLSAILGTAGFESIEWWQERHHSWIRHSAQRSHGFLAGIARTRLGSGIMGIVGRMWDRADGIIARAVRR